MYDFTRIPVEIWHQIIFTTFDAPYVLDTVIDRTEGCYWHQQDRYHDEKAYMESERQRGVLRRVCRSWKLFVDKHRCRWVTFDSSADSEDAKQIEAKVAIEYAGQPKSSESQPITPKRLIFPVATSDDLTLLNTVLCGISQKLTTLGVECSNDYRDEVFTTLIINQDSLPSLRCLMLTQPKTHSTPLQSISNAFPKLTGLTVCGNEIITPFPEDSIILPDLQSLYFDVPSMSGMRPEGWELPRILRLVVPIDVGDTDEVGISLVRLYGSQLVFLDLICWSTGKLPAEFWTWCPVLTELQTCLTRIDLGGPLPVNHPLKYVIHLPDPSFLQAEAHEDSFLWRNLQFLPTHLECMIFASSRGWQGYLERLEVQCERNQINAYFERISEITKEITVEDEQKTTLGAFLQTLY